MLKRIASFFLAVLLMAQVATVPNSTFPTFRTNLNASLANAASITGSYSNPSWITSLAWTKITGAPGSQTLIFGGGAVLTESLQSIDQGYVVITQGGNLTLSGAAEQYFNLATGVSCNTRFTRSLISVTTQFSGGSTGLWAKLQHNGVDITAPFSLVQSGGDVNIYTEVPAIACMGAATATLRVAIYGDGAANKNLYTAGAFTVEVAGYSAR